MGILGFLNKETLGAPQAGIANGLRPGHLGAWVIWDARSNSTEVYRVVVKAESITGLRVDPATYTFVPAHDGPFCQSVETTLQLKEFLVGAYRASKGTVTFDFLLAGNAVVSVSHPLDYVLKCLRGKGPEAPTVAKRIEGYLEKDTSEIAALKHADLKAHSEAAKKAIAEKLRKEEEERKAKEAAAAEAAKKAADAAKAAAAAKASAAARPAGEAAGGPTISGGRVAIFYGSSTGNTKNTAEAIKAELGSVDHVVNVANCSPADFNVCEIMLFGIPTWHIGELQDDWALILPQVAGNFAGKKVAMFGLGDAKGYPETYVDAMAELLAPFEKGGAKLFGLWPTDGYDFKGSKALRDGKFMGLVIDVENQDQLSDKRVKAWCKQIKTEMGI